MDKWCRRERFQRVPRNTVESQEVVSPSRLRLYLRVGGPNGRRGPREEGGGGQRKRVKRRQAGGITSRGDPGPEKAKPSECVIVPKLHDYLGPNSVGPVFLETGLDREHRDSDVVSIYRSSEEWDCTLCVDEGDVQG